MECMDGLIMPNGPLQCGLVACLWPLHNMTGGGSEAFVEYTMFMCAKRLPHHASQYGNSYMEWLGTDTFLIGF